jgi:hypothetical protein
MSTLSLDFLNDFSIRDIHGCKAHVLLNYLMFSIDFDSDLYWKLRVAQLVESERLNIPLGSVELYVYDHLLTGFKTWKEYYSFLNQMVIEYSMF